MSYLPSYDKRLVARITKYVSEHRFVDCGVMASDLQIQYHTEYGRRKKNAFKKLVSLIYESLNGNKRISLNQIENKHKVKRLKEANKTNVENKSDSEELVEYPDTNLINDSLSSMYNGDVSSLSMPVKLSPTQMSHSFDQPVKNRVEKWYDSNNSQSKAENGINGNINLDFETINELNDATTPLKNLPDKQENKKKPGKSKKDGTKKSLKSESLSDELNDFRKKKYIFESSKVKFENVGGNNKTLQEVCKLLIHMKHPEVYQALGVSPPHGVLLHGPPGCGKSLLANAIAGEMELPMLKMAATEIVSGVSGDSEQKLRDIFEVAVENSPCIIFLDEIDAIAPKRETASKEMERRIVAQLLSCMDDMNSSLSQILIIGATNRPDSLDPALRRAGRFDKEIAMGIPDENARKDILRVLCKDLKLEKDFNFAMVARLTPGYVGADLLSLCREAATITVSNVLMYKNLPKHDHDEMDISDNIEISQEQTINKQIIDLNNDNMIHKNSYAKETIESDNKVFQMLSWLRNSKNFTEDELAKLCITMTDFEKALKVVQPSAKREGFATVPDVTWADIGALETIREELSVSILAPVRNPDAFKALGLVKPPGVLLVGPPGCGKTMLAKAIANESGLNFISVKGPELLNMYVGESERAVRQCFQRAQNSSPCVIFFDELDSLCPKRSGTDTGSSARVVNQMLTEMDGLEARKQVFVMAATNRPDIIDPAILRPGRLDKSLFVDLPSKEDRFKILMAITKDGTKPKIASDLSLQDVANDSRCDRFTGADLSALIREASVNALKKYISQQHVLNPVNTTTVFVNGDNFENAFAKVKPSVSIKDQEKYLKLKNICQ